MYPVITISREFGSGGHSIGMAVAEKLGIPFLDSKIVEEVAKESGFAKEYVKEQDEMATYPELFITSNIFSTNYLDTPQEQIQQLQSEYIIEQAKKGPCVIAGRCADYVLENAGIPSLNVFIHASMEYRNILYQRYQTVPFLLNRGFLCYSIPISDSYHPIVLP